MKFCVQKVYYHTLPLKELKLRGTNSVQFLIKIFEFFMATLRTVPTY